MNWFQSNKCNPSHKQSGLHACISSRITTGIQVVRDYQRNYNWYNEPFAVFKVKELYLDMHGLIFETSVWLLAESTRLLPFFDRVAHDVYMCVCSETIETCTFYIHNRQLTTTATTTTTTSTNQTPRGRCMREVSGVLTPEKHLLRRPWPKVSTHKTTYTPGIGVFFNSKKGWTISWGISPPIHRSLLEYLQTNTAVMKRLH